MTSRAAVLVLASIVSTFALRPSLVRAACDGGAPDGVVTGSEACDDGNPRNDDNCLTDCTVAACGDGFVHTLGRCSASGAACTPPAVCAGGDVCVVTGGVETCDDGGTLGGDGCGPTCGAEGGKCAAARLGAVAKEAAGMLGKCHAKATLKGGLVDPGCMDKLEQGFVKGFDKAASKGDCRVEGNAGATGALVESFVEDDVAAALGGSALPSKCTSTKLKQTAKTTQSVIKCHANAAKKGTAVDQGCLMKAEGKFSSAFQKAESSGDCLAPVGDAGAIQTAIGTFVTQLVGMTNVDRAETVRAEGPGGVPLFTVRAEQIFHAANEMAFQAEVAHPQTVHVTIAFPDGLAVPVVFERLPDGTYQGTAFDDPPFVIPDPTFSQHVTLRDFTAGAVAFAMRRNNWLHAGAVAGSLQPGRILDVYVGHLQTPDDLGIVQASQPYGFGWNQHCYTDGQDFECSDLGDTVIPETITLHYQAVVGWFLFWPILEERSVQIDWTDCCLKHDRDFFCGGDFGTFHQANLNLANCVADKIFASIPGFDLAETGAAAWWWSVFYFGTNVGNLVTNVPGWPAPGGSGWRQDLFNRRAQSCLCGGSEPVPLCDDPCEVNDCTSSPPAVYRRSAFVDMCVPSCEWVCVQTEASGTWQSAMCDKRDDDALYDCQQTACTPADPPPPPAQCGPL